MGGYGFLAGKLAGGAKKVKAGATRKRKGRPVGAPPRAKARGTAPKPGVVGVIGPGGQKLDVPKKSKGTARKAAPKAKRASRLTGSSRKRMRK